MTTLSRFRRGSTLNKSEAQIALDNANRAYFNSKSKEDNLKRKIFVHALKLSTFDMYVDQDAADDWTADMNDIVKEYTAVSEQSEKLRLDWLKLGDETKHLFEDDENDEER